MSMTSLE